MLHIASLIANPERPALDGAVLARVAAALPEPGEVRWLAEGIAAEVPFEADAQGLADIRTRVVEALGTITADLNLLPARDRRKRLLLADMDSTMIGQECIDELADLVGLREKISAITERAMRGEIAFEPALRERVALLKGIGNAEIQRMLAERITLTPGATALVRTMRAAGAYTALVSGGFTSFTGPVSERIGFHEHRGNLLDLEGAVLAGTVAEPILGRDAKRATLIELRERLGLDREQTLAVGDGANDLAMLDEAGLGVAYRAKPAVAEAADARIDHGDLTALLYLQGYSRSEFAS